MTKRSYFALLTWTNLANIAYLAGACWWASHRADPAPSPVAGGDTVWLVLGTTVLFMAVLYHVLKTAGKTGEHGQAVKLSPERFHQITRTSVAIAEVNCLLGLLCVLQGAPVPELVPFVAATITTELVCIVPTGRRYWAARERMGR